MQFPGEKTPTLSLPTLDHGAFDLDDPQGENGTLLVFYRGLHCPLCIKQMAEAEGLIGDFDKRGVDLVFISTDNAERARETMARAEVSKLKVAHSLSLPAARFDWGLYISSAREGSNEPALFTEPGMCYVLSDRTHYAGWAQTSPFARPRLEDTLKAIDMAIDKGYPPRGLYQGSLDKDAAA